MNTAVLNDDGWYDVFAEGAGTFMCCVAEEKELLEWNAVLYKGTLIWPKALRALRKKIMKRAGYKLHPDGFEGSKKC